MDYDHTMAVNLCLFWMYTMGFKRCDHLPYLLFFWGSI